MACWELLYTMDSRLIAIGGLVFFDIVCLVYNQCSATTVLKSNLIRSIYFERAVAWRMKRASPSWSEGRYQRNLGLFVLSF